MKRFLFAAIAASVLCLAALSQNTTNAPSVIGYSASFTTNPPTVVGTNRTILYAVSLGSISLSGVASTNTPTAGSIGIGKGIFWVSNGVYYATVSTNGVTAITTQVVP